MIKEWAGAILIIVGIVSFQFIPLQKQSSNQHQGGNLDKGDFPYGLVLLGISLFKDGLMATCQITLRREAKRIIVQTMLYTNVCFSRRLPTGSYPIYVLDVGGWLLAKGNCLLVPTGTILDFWLVFA